MAYPVCVDASILIKWVIPEDDSDVALDLLSHFIESGAVIIEPTLAVYEAPSAIRRKVAKQQLTEAEAQEAVSKVRFLLSQVNLSAEEWRRVQRAWQIASDHRLGRIYDCIYLALAEELGAECWTADAGFYNAASQHSPHLRLLSNFTL